MIRTALSLARSFLAPIFISGFLLALLPGGATAQQGCNPPTVFPTPILSTPAGCPSYLTYFNDWPYDTKFGNTAMAVGDFNNDGKQDVVVALSLGGYAGVGLAVMLGNGDGTFQAPIYLAPCCSPDLRNETWVAVGDFNNDGNLDIAGGTNYGGGGYIYILLGNGDGTFRAPFYLFLNAAAGGAVGDFNGDGNLDIVVTNFTSSPGTALIYFGNGDGTLNPTPTVVSLPSGDAPNGVVVGDFNHDGKLDFATANNTTYYGSVSVVFGNGDGTFQPPVDYSTFTQTPYNPGSHAVSIVAADLNNDGSLDLAALDRDSNEVSVFLNNGNGTFSGPTYYGGWVGNNGDGAYPQQIAAADFNHDGKLDLVVTASPYYGAGAAVLFGNGDGTFQQPAVSYATDIHLSSVAVGDFNGDGVPDIVASSDPLDTLTVLLNKGDGTFKGARNYPPFVVSGGNFGNGAPDPVSVAFGDLNGDGKVDMVVANNSALNATVYFNNGDGTFTENANYRTDPTDNAYGPNAVIVADLRNNGTLDLVAALSSGGSSVSTLLGNGDGTFQPAVVYNPNLGGATILAVVDVNGDGFPDIVFNGTNTYQGANVYVLYVALGNGDGTFKTPVATPDICMNAGWGAVIAAAVADVNGDHKPDIIASCNQNGGPYPSTIYILPGNGDGTFGAATAVPAGTFPTFISVGDFNADGIPDLVVGNNGSAGPTFSVLLGTGGGNFQSPMSYSDVDSPFWTNWSSAQISGYGNPNPAPYPQAVVIGDFNKDGHLDLLVADIAGQIGGGSNGGYWDNGVQLFLGNGDGTFQLEQSYLACWHGQAVAAADITGSGALSAAVACPSDGVVSVLVNQLTTKTVSTTTALTPSANPSAFGQSVTFTATVTPASGSTTPSGSVTFMDGSSTLGASDLNSAGQATYSTSALALGTHSVTAIYAATTGFTGSTSAVLNQVVSQSSTTTSLASSLNPSALGQSVTFTATVAPSSGSGTPTGTVAFYDGTTSIGTGTLSGGKATLATSALSLGSHSITAVYGGDSDFTGSTSAILTQVVSKTGTSTSLQSSLNPSTYGQSVTFTATITWAGSGTPTGTVTFMDGVSTLGSNSLSGSKATYSTAALAPGSHSITATYSGDGNFAGSTSSTLTQTVNKVATSTSVVSSKNPSVAGQSITLTASVTPAGTVTAGGTATFMDGSVILGSRTLNSSSQATLSTSTLAAGTHSITVVFAGTTNYAGSTSSVLSQRVEDFSISATPATQTITPGQSATYMATLAPLGGFTASVSLSCSGAPLKGSCTVPKSVPLNGTTNGTATLIVKTASGKKGTPAGSYTVTLTSTSGTLKHTTTVNVVVE